MNARLRGAALCLGPACLLSCGGDVTPPRENGLPILSAVSITVPEDSDVLVDVLAAAQDPDGHPLEIVSFTTPSHGSVAREGTGLRYAPPADYHGSDAFDVTVGDTEGGRVTGSVDVSVLPVNDAPVALDDAADVQEDTPQLLNVLANDADVDGDVLVVAIVAAPANGRAEVEAGGVRYTPAADYNGTDSLRYAITDPDGLEAAAWARVRVLPTNDRPVLAADSAAGLEDESLRVDVLANDSDPDGDPLEIDGFTQGAWGTVTTDVAGLLYVPAADGCGADAFDYTGSDGEGGLDTAAVHVSITCVNDAPVAMADSASVAEDGTTLIDVRGNDVDVDGDSLQIASVTPAAHGTAAIEDGQIRYTPEPDYVGSDAFDYVVSDGTASRDTASVVLTVTSTNRAPVAADDSATVMSGDTVALLVLANDTDPDGDDLEIVTFLPSGHGFISWVGDTLFYIAEEIGYVGPDQFDYVVGDGRATDTATVHVTVTAIPNTPPAAADDDGTVLEDSSATFDVLANDSDADGDSLFISGVSSPSHGSVGVVAGGLRYTATDPHYHGPDAFTYTVSDGESEAGASVSVTITPVNDPPEAVADEASVEQGGSVLIDVVANDADVDGEALAVAELTRPAHGTAAVEGGQIRYTPDATYHGADAFSYVASDGNGGLDTAEVSLTVVYVNAAPITTRDSLRVQQGSSQLIDVLANDSDPDGDALTLAGVFPAQAGSAAVEANQVRYTPDPAFWGWDVVEYEVSDGNGGTARDTLEVHVNGAPIGAPDAASGAEDDVGIHVFVLSNDVDPEEIIPLEITGFTQGEHGTVTMTEGRPGLDLDWFTYSPPPDWYGTDTFTYDIVDVFGGTDAGIEVTVTVSPVNDAPVAADDAFDVNEDEAALLDVLANDSDLEGDAFTITDVTPTSLESGTAEIVGTQVRYTPPADFVGTDVFSYQITDAGGATAFGDVILTVLDTNDPPVAVDDAVSLNEDGTVLIDVLANDSDPDSDALTITAILGGDLFADRGVEDGQIRYTPHPDANSDWGPGFSFRYVVSDGRGGLDTAWVNVDVVPVDDPTVAVDDVATVDEDGTVMIVVTANDPNGDSHNEQLTVTGVTQGAHGTVTEAYDLVYYTPDADWNGTDSFTYTITDGNTEDTGTVTVTVNPVNDVPVAADDAATVEEDGSVLVDVMANDYDVDGFPIFVASVHDVQNGTAYATSGGAAVQFTPTPNFYGTATLSYVVADASHGAPDTATVVVTVTPVPDAPAVRDSTYTISQGQTVLIDTYPLFSDADHDSGYLEGFTQPADGIVTQEGDAVRYTPSAGWTGTAVFTVTMHDGTGVTPSATGTITVVVEPAG